MSLYLFARFHAQEGNQSALRDALLEVVIASREEAGCLEIHAFQSVRDPLEFFIHSRWKDKEAFEIHATLPHTVRFVERVRGLIDNEFAPTLAEKISDLRRPGR